MSENPALHARLIARQSDEELERKARKAINHKSKLWTQEELDAADREAERLYRYFQQMQLGRQIASEHSALLAKLAKDP